MEKRSISFSSDPTNEVDNKMKKKIREDLVYVELEADAVTLLKRIRKFSITQDIGARAAIHIFNRISFAIAKGVGPR
ncbi:hypothetical protein Tco_0791789 [Tanacetum coccineum]